MTTIVYRTDFAGRSIKPKDESNPGNIHLVNLVGTTGAAAQLLIAAAFGTMISARTGPAHVRAAAAESLF